MMVSNYLNYILKTFQRDDKVLKESTFELHVRIDTTCATSNQSPVHTHSEEAFMIMLFLYMTSAASRL